MRNRLEKTIELSAWVIMILLLFKFVPKNRIREAQVSFLFKQAVTWLFGLLVVEKKLISYPYRLFFKKTIKSSFTFEYFVYPSLCVLFNLYYPDKRNYPIKLLYYLFHSAIITGLEVVLLKYTKLIKYKKWTWYWSLLSMTFTNYLSHVYFKWFFKEQVSRQK
ncbi:CBO0543 family protein [Paucisalibacillus globulus]|uniref:CBO0543 family protein n=1 Tax=Paucisalibacillus globulus TaxID=351095 RepID=UPI000BB8BCD6|nr:CBO0543 family protein [Paucisalibacillus globulus]